MTPLQIRSNIQLSHRYRFVSTSATSTGITPTSMMCAAGGMCYSANTDLASFYGSVKINHIEIWCPPASQGANATCSVDWVGYQNSPNIEVSDTTVSVSMPAHVRCTPPRQSLASFWQVAGATSLCNIIAPVGSIIDVDMALILQDGDVAQAISSVTSATLGSIYYLSLDSNATHRYTPVSLTTTT